MPLSTRPDHEPNADRRDEVRRLARDLRLALQKISVGGIVMWTIYDRPTDFPGHFVVRPWYLSTPGPGGKVVEMPHLEAIACDDLGQAREIVLASSQGGHPPICLGREATDDRAIVETWLA